MRDSHDQRFARRVERRVLRFIRESIPLHADRPLLLAVSGGADSLALLHIVASLQSELGATGLIAAYIDHELRPAEEVEAERAFVEAAAQDLALGFVSARVEHGADDHRRSPEERARRGRYQVLGRLARESGASQVATGHTRTDQAETVLLRMLRGSGLTGLSAMQPAARWPLAGDHPPELVRPILCLGREETAVYCQSRGLTPRVDSENRNPRYTRNRVRAEVLPILRSFNPRIEYALADLAAEAGEWRSIIAGTVSPGSAPDTGGGDRVELDVPTLRLAATAERIHAVRSALAAIMPDAPAPARRHILAVDRLVFLGGGRTLCLPGNLQAWREADKLILGSRAVAGRSQGADSAVPIPGELVLPGWRVTTLVTEPATPLPADRWSVWLDRAVLDGLVVGPRRPGDRIELAGLAGRKRLQDLFVDEGVPRLQRENWPVFRTNRGIAWVAGLRTAGWAQSQSGPALLLRAQPLPESDAGKGTGGRRVQ